MKSVTCTAPVNIAVVKYWGKRDESLILPTNSSLSVTLDQKELCAKTTVATSVDFAKDRMWLNGEEQDVNAPRVQKVLREIRRRARKRKLDEGTQTTLKWHLHICSENNFPTAAGLASSAAGYASLVFALAKLFKIDGEISDIARQGSGSACRSMYGGFVQWQMGGFPSGEDSVARPVTLATHWPEMRILVLVVSDAKKAVNSTEGMKTSVATSDLLQHRIQHVVPIRVKLMSRVILNTDFYTFTDLTMKDSNQFHAVCQDTYPPIAYMNDASHNIVRMVHAINKYHGTHNKAGYTFDAGPNACLFVLEKDTPLIMSIIKHFFPPTENGEEFIHGPDIPTEDIPQELLDSIAIPKSPGAIQYVIHTRIGPGPKVLAKEEDCLLGNDGLPRKTPDDSDKESLLEGDGSSKKMPDASDNDGLLGKDDSPKKTPDTSDKDGLLENDGSPKKAPDASDKDSLLGNDGSPKKTPDASDTVGLLGNEGSPMETPDATDS